MTVPAPINQTGLRVDSIVLNSFTNDSRVLKSGKSLVAAGYQVRVIALHDGSELASKETIDGIAVYRVELRSKGWSKWKPVQLLKYAEFVFRVCRDYQGAEILHCNDLNALFAGVVCKCVSRNKPLIVYDAHEHESERNGFSTLMRRVTRWVERALLPHADRVITVSSSIADDYEKIYRIARPEVIYNAPYFSERLGSNILRTRLGIAERQKIFLYQGALVPGRGIEVALRVFERVNSELCLVVVGGGPLAHLVQQASARCSNIFHVGMVSPADLAELTCSADYGIALIENTCRSYYMCMPNKLFEFMMAELPVVVSNMLELEGFVTKYRVGVVSGASESDLNSAIHAIVGGDYEGYVRNIRVVKSMFTWEQQERKLIGLYDSLAGVNRSTLLDTFPVREG